MLMDCCQCKTKCPPYYWVLNSVFFQEPDALGLVPIKPVDVKIRHVIPFYDLKVSQYSSLSYIMFLSTVQFNILCLKKWPQCAAQ